MDAIKVPDSLNRDGNAVNDVEKVNRMVSKAQFYANSGDIKKAGLLLDSINHDRTKSVFEGYAYIGMLKATLQFKETGCFPSEMMHKVTKNIHRNYHRQPL